MAELCPRLRCDVIAAALAVDGAGVSLGGRPIDASDEAFAMLTRQSQQQNVKLREIAEGIVKTAWRRRD